MRLVPALAALALVAGAAGCGGATKTTARAGPTTGPFFSDLGNVRSTLLRGGVALAALVPGAPPDSLLTRPPHSYKIRTRGGTQAMLLIYATPQKAMRARASAGPHTVLGNNVLAVITRRGKDIQRVRSAIGNLDHRPA